MDYVWSAHAPIAIHITSLAGSTARSEGEYSPENLQSLANYEDLPVRDLITEKNYYPK